MTKEIWWLSVSKCNANEVWRKNAVLEGRLGWRWSGVGVFFGGVWCSWGAHKSVVLEGGLGWRWSGVCVRVVVVCGVAGDHTQQHKIQHNNHSKHKNTTKTYNNTPNNNCDFSCAMSLAGIEPKMFCFRPFSANCYRSGRSLVKTRKKVENFSNP